MSCSCCGFSDSAEQHFTSEDAAAEIARYRKKGPGPTTKLLLDGLAREGPISGSVLDVGGGVGALSFELLDRGAGPATIVDASSAYLEMATNESRRRSRADVTRVVTGDFVMMADELPSAHIVTLDRVVCCYPEYEPLVRQAVNHAEHRFAYSYPRDRWFVRLGVRLENVVRRWKGNRFRTFVHPPLHMEQIIRSAGFELVSRRSTLTWSADVFVRRRSARDL